MLLERVSIVGAGLMGGSMAMALRPFISHLTIIDRDPETRTACVAIADAVTDATSHSFEPLIIASDATAEHFKWHQSGERWFRSAQAGTQAVGTWIHRL